MQRVGNEVWVGCADLGKSGSGKGRGECGERVNGGGGGGGELEGPMWEWRGTLEERTRCGLKADAWTVDCITVGEIEVGLELLGQEEVAAI